MRWGGGNADAPPLFGSAGGAEQVPRWGWGSTGERPPERWCSFSGGKWGARRCRLGALCPCSPRCRGGGAAALTRGQVGRGCRLSPGRSEAVLLSLLIEPPPVPFSVPKLRIRITPGSRAEVGASGRSGAWGLARCHARASGPGEDLAELGRPKRAGPGDLQRAGLPTPRPPIPGRRTGVGGLLHAAKDPDDIGNPLNKH